MKKLLIGTLLILTACGGGSTPTPTPPPSAFNVSGGWTGTITANNMTTTFNLQLVQATGSDDITGTIYNATGTGTLAGKLSTGVLAAKASDGSSGTFTGSLTATTYKGTFTADLAAPGGSNTATFSFTKNQ